MFLSERLIPRVRHSLPIFIIYSWYIVHEQDTWVVNCAHLDSPFQLYVLLAIILCHVCCIILVQFHYLDCRMLSCCKFSKWSSKEIERAMYIIYIYIYIDSLLYMTLINQLDIFYKTLHNGVSTHNYNTAYSVLHDTLAWCSYSLLSKTFKRMMILL